MSLMPRAARGVFQPARDAPIDPRMAYGHSGAFSISKRRKDGLYEFITMTRGLDPEVDASETPESGVA